MDDLVSGPLFSFKIQNLKSATVKLEARAWSTKGPFSCKNFWKKFL
jgi:hypothetical protein